MRKKFRVEPMLRTKSDEDAHNERALLKMQYFAFGIAATALALAMSLPGFWQTGSLMLFVAIVIGIIRRRYGRWSYIDEIPVDTKRLVSVIGMKK